jgi:hypothetical protein
MAKKGAKGAAAAAATAGGATGAVKKSRGEGINTKLALVMKSGKVKHPPRHPPFRPALRQSPLSITSTYPFLCALPSLSSPSILSAVWCA